MYGETFFFPYKLVHQTLFLFEVLDRMFFVSKSAKENVKREDTEKGNKDYLAHYSQSGLDSINLPLHTLYLLCTIVCFLYSSGKHIFIGEKPGREKSELKADDDLFPLWLQERNLSSYTQGVKSVGSQDRVGKLCKSLAESPATLVSK